MKKAKTSSQRFFLASTILILSLACFYVFQIVKLTEANYLMGSKETDEKLLKQDIAKLELSVTKDRSLKNFEARASEEGYQKISNINYIVVTEASVASAK